MATTERLLERISGDRAAEILSELIKRRSQNPIETEEDVARFVVSFCGELGLETSLQEVLSGRPNAHAWLHDEPGPTLTFNTHLDTVPAGAGWSVDPFGGEVRSGKVFGRGAVDAKGPLASFLIALEALKSAGARLKGRLLLTAAADEEFASRGSRLAVEGLDCRYAVVGEPTGCRLGIAHRGSLRPVLVVGGVAAHSSRPDQGVNAIFESIGVLRNIERYGTTLSSRRHPLCGSATCTVTLISGGVKDNVIPDRCEFTIDRRMIPGESEEGAVREIEGILAEAVRENPELRVRIDRLLPTTGGPSETPMDDPLVQAALRVSKNVLGREPEIYGMSGACDMTHYRAIGASAIVLGPGDEEMCHKADEHVDARQLVDAARIYAAIALELLR